jgi:hypothetical protein
MDINSKINVIPLTALMILSMFAKMTTANTNNMNIRTAIKKRLERPLTRLLSIAATIALGLHGIVALLADHIIPHYWIYITLLILIGILIAFYIAFSFKK